jgi:hypothetical protein
MNKEFVKDAMGITTKENMEEGQVVFKEGEPAFKGLLGRPISIIGWSREALSATIPKPNSW